MKTLILFLLLIPNVIFAQMDNTNIKWSNTTHDFGNIPFNIPATHEFILTNTGTDTLRITSVEASCGCTKPDWSMTPILPNQTGFVRATYRAGSEGPFSKQVTVYTNRSGMPTNLVLKGVVSPQIHTDGDGHKH